MVANRPRYRARQFFTALLAHVAPDEIEQALTAAALPGAAGDLFRRLPRPYQRHALNVFQRLLAEGASDTALLTAALLHDMGKWDPRSGRSVALPYRVANTLLRRVAPGRKALRYLGGRRPASVLRYPFVLQQHHADLGAALARRAGVADDAVTLIRLHEQPPQQAADHLRERLVLLQQADDLE